MHIRYASRASFWTPRQALALAFCTALLIVFSSASAAARPGGTTRAQGMTSVIVTLRQQANVRAVAHGSRRQREKATIETLRATADKTQVGLRTLLRTRKGEGRVARAVTLWIFNGLAVTASPDVIRELANRPEVESVTPDATIQAPTFSQSSSAPEANISLVNAPAVWDLGDRGQGVVVANMDTGVDVSHPDLASRWRGGTNSWYDPNGEHPATPTDVSGHGTETMGVIVGGDAGGTSIGIAPDAQWIAVKIFNDHGAASTSAIHLGYQWLLDPDGNPNTPDAPDVVNNSWGFSNPGCNLAFQPDLQSLRAAGILPVFAAGNSGPNASTSVSPANYPEAFAVGATDATDAIFPGGSRGPSSCGEAQTTFPELVAPGVSIRSSDLYGGYASSTGTSLAAPHVAGVLALLLSALPNATPDQQASALESGAVDLGAPGSDNTFGYGRLDALAAYNWLGSHPDFSLSASPASASRFPGGGVTFAVSVTPTNGFSGDVSLSLTGLSSAQGSWTFTPATVVGGSGSSQLSVTAAASLPPGSYPLTISGSGGGLTRSTSATLVVTSPPDFSLSASPASASTFPGGSVTFAVSATPANGFSGDVSLSLSGLPSAQGSWTFTPATVVGGSGSSQLSVTAAASLPPGSYPLTIGGSGGGSTRSTSVTLIVNAPSPDFSISISPTARKVQRGGSTTYTVTVSSKNNFSGTVAFSASGLPAKSSVTFKPTSVRGHGSSTMTVRTSGSTPSGTFGLTVSGTSGPIVHSAAATLTVK